MTKTKKIILWFGLILSVPAGGYSGVSIIFYSWLQASQQWPTFKSAIWVIGSVILTGFFIYLFFHCLFALTKEPEKVNKHEET